MSLENHNIFNSTNKIDTLNDLENFSLTELFVKDGIIYASNGQKFFEIDIQSKQEHVQSENTVQKMLFSLGEGQFEQISTSDIRINNQPLSIFNKKPFFETRMGVKDQLPIQHLKINDVERFLNQEVLDEEDPIVILLGDDQRVLNTEITFRFPNGLFALTQQAQKIIYKDFHIRIQIQKKLEVSENVFENEGIVDLFDPENDTIPYRDIKISRKEDRQFDHNIAIDFRPYLSEGERGGVFELTITRISPFDNTFQMSRVNLLRFTEYIFVENDENIAYSDNPLLYMEAEAQTNLQGQIPKVEIRVKGNKTSRCREIIEDSFYGQTNENPPQIPKDFLDYKLNEQMQKFFNLVSRELSNFVHTIGEIENIEIKNISTGEFTTIKNVTGEGVITLRSTIFKNPNGGERFVIKVKRHSFNLIDQFHDLITNPDYGLGRAFNDQIINYDNLKEIAEYHDDWVPIDGDNFLLEGEMGGIFSSNLNSNSNIKTDFNEAITINFNSLQLNLFERLYERIYDLNYSNYNHGVIKTILQTDFTEEVEFFTKPILLTQYETSAENIVVENGEETLQVNFKLPIPMQSYYTTSIGTGHIIAYEGNTTIHGLNTKFIEEFTNHSPNQVVKIGFRGDRYDVVSVVSDTEMVISPAALKNSGTVTNTNPNNIYEPCEFETYDYHKMGSNYFQDKNEGYSEYVNVKDSDRYLHEQNNVNASDFCFHTSMLGFEQSEVDFDFFFKEIKSLPMIYEIKFEGSVGEEWKTIKTFMTGHKYSNLTPPNYGAAWQSWNVKTKNRKRSNIAIINEFKIDLYDFVTNILGLTITNNILKNLNIRMTVRALHHLFYYSDSNQFQNRIEEIVSLEDTFGDINTVGSDIYINNELFFNILQETKQIYTDRHPLRRISYITGDNTVYSNITVPNIYDNVHKPFAKGLWSDNFYSGSKASVFHDLAEALYDRPRQNWRLLKQLVPTATKQNYFAVSFNENAKIQYEQVLTSGNLHYSKIGIMASYHSMQYAQGFINENENEAGLDLSTIVKLQNYTQPDLSGNDKTISPVNVDEVVTIKSTEFKSDEFSSIYKQVEDIEVNIGPGDIIYNLTNMKRARIVNYVYYDLVNLVFSTNPNHEKRPDYLELSENIFNIDGLDDEGNVAKYRIYSKAQCEKRHKSSFVISQFYDPKQYLSSMLSATNTLINIQGNKIDLSVEGLSKANPRSEAIISEADLVPGSLSVESKAKDSVPNTIEIQFMDENNRNTKSTITVRDRNALQGIDEDGNFTKKPQPERKAQVFFPQISRASEAIRKANRDLNFAKFVDHTISFNTYGIGGHLNIGDTFQFRAPITRMGTSGSVVKGTPINNDLENFTDLDQMIIQLATPVGDILDGEIISNQTGNMDISSGDYDYDRSRVGTPSEGYIDSRDYWALVFSDDGYSGKFKLEKINGFEIIIKKTNILTQWIEFKHDELKNIKNGYRIIIGVKNDIATRYRLVRKRKIHSQGIVEFQAHPYHPEIYSDFSTFSVLNEVSNSMKNEKRSSNDPPKAITNCNITKIDNKIFQGQTEGFDDVANIPEEFIYQKIFDISFDFGGSNDPLYAHSDVYWRWNHESNYISPSSEGDGWKKLSGSPFVNSFEISNLHKTIENSKLLILIQPISMMGVRLGIEQCKVLSTFIFDLKEQNEVVDFPKSFSADFNALNLIVSLDWKPTQGINRYMIHTLIKDSSQSYGGDFGWGFPYSTTYKPFGNSKLSSNILDGTHFEYKVAQPGTYQFFIRGITDSGYISGELTDFSVEYLAIRNDVASPINWETQDVTLLDSNDVMYIHRDESDDVNLLVELLQKNVKVKNYAIFGINTDRDKSGFAIRAGHRISGNKFSLIGNIDLSYLIDSGFALLNLTNSANVVGLGIDFGFEQDFEQMDVSSVGPGFIEFASDPFSNSEDLNDYILIGFDLSNNYITGKILCVSGDSEIVGTGTDFVTELQNANIDKLIILGKEYTITSVTDATHLNVSPTPNFTRGNLRCKKLEDDEKYLIATNHTENPTDGVARTAARVTNLSIRFSFVDRANSDELNKLLYQRTNLLKNRMVNRIQTLNPNSYNMLTIFGCDKNVLTNIEGYRPSVIGNNFRSSFDNTKEISYVTGPYRTLNERGAAYREYVKWKILKPVAVGAGIAEIQGSTEITFPAVTNVSMLKVNYDPKTSKIKANWEAQTTPLLDYYLIKAGFFTTGTTAPDYDNSSLETFTTKSNEFLFDANSIDEDITGNKTFIIYVLGVDSFETHFPTTQSGFTTGVNLNTFNIEALPEVEFTSNDIIERTYSDNTGNVVSEILLKFRIPDSTWKPTGKNLKNVVRHFKIQTREIKTPIGMGSISAVADLNKVTDSVNFGLIAAGSQTSDYQHDASDSKFNEKMLKNVVSGEEAFIISTENNNTFVLDRNITQSVGDTFEIIDRYQLQGVAIPQTDTLALDQTTNREFQYKIPIVEQGSKFYSLAKWQFKITAVNNFDIENSGAIAEKQFVGKTEAIERPQNSEVREVPGGVVFEIQKPADADFAKFQFRAVYLPDTNDDVNLSFELKTSLLEDQYFSSEIDKNGSWVFYIFSVDKSGNKSLGFSKLELDVTDKPVKQIVQTVDLMNTNTNSFRKYHGMELGADGNIYPKPKMKELSFYVNHVSTNSNYLRLQNPAIFNIYNNDLTSIYSQLFDPSIIENIPFVVVETGKIGFTTTLNGSVTADTIYPPTGGNVDYIDIYIDDPSIVSIGQNIKFEVPQTYATEYLNINYWNTLPQLEVQTYSNVDNPSWRFDGNFHLNGEIGWSGGFPPRSTGFFETDVVEIQDVDLLVDAQLMPQYASDNVDELEDTADFYIYYRTGGSLEEFFPQNYTNNPFVQFKKFRIEQPTFIQFLAVFAPKSTTTNASIKSLKMILDKEFRRIQVNDGTNNYIDIPTEGYSFRVHKVKEIITYAGLSVIDDSVSNIKRVYIDTASINNSGNATYNIFIRVIDSNGQFTSGRISGYIEVY